MIQPFQATIEDSALQLYSSALAFVPFNSIISQHYHDRFNNLVPKVIRGRWDLQSQSISLIGHNNCITCIEFSPDGRRIRLPRCARPAQSSQAWPRHQRLPHPLPLHPAPALDRPTNYHVSNQNARPVITPITHSSCTVRPSKNAT